MRYLSVLLVFLASDGYAACKAILFNGGGETSSNYQIHLQQIQAFYTSMRSQGCKAADIVVLSASGNREAKDFRETPIYKNEISKPFAAIKGDYGFVESGSLLLPANRKGLTDAVAAIRRSSKPGDKVFVSLLDHGSSNGLVPWKENDLNPRELDSILSSLPSDRSMKVWTECCYCGRFTSLQRPNTCVMSSTDSGHVGDYRFRDYVNVLNMFPTNTFNLIKNSFASNMKANRNASFRAVAQTSQLENDNPAYTRAAKQYGDPIVAFGNCRVGPRNSVEAFKLKVIGYSNRPICFEDFARELVFAMPPSCSLFNDYNGIDGIINFAKLVQSYPNVPPLMKLKSNLALILKFVVASKELAAIKKLDADFAKLPRATKLKEAYRQQRLAESLKDRLFKKVIATFGRALDGSWSAALDAVFFKRATVSERSRAKELEACLNSPVL